MPLTFSKASKGLVPKITSGEVEAGDGGGQQLQGEQGKLLLEVETLCHLQWFQCEPGLLGGHFQEVNELLQL